jgi:hypothetical protein
MLGYENKGKNGIHHDQGMQRTVADFITDYLPDVKTQRITMCQDRANEADTRTNVGGDAFKKHKRCGGGKS